MFGRRDRRQRDRRRRDRRKRDRRGGWGRSPVVPAIGRAGSTIFVGCTVLVGCAVLGDAPSSSGEQTGSAASAPVGATAEAAQELSSAVDVEVVRVIDGDSLRVLADGTELEVRLVGINAPELRTRANRETCAGQAAKAELDSLLGAGTVSLFDEGIDRFGRTLAHLVVDGRPVGEAMVDSGWALALWSSEETLLIDRMRDAAEAERGWWGSTCGVAQMGLAVGDTQVNAPGDDRERLNEEWVEIVNREESPIGLTGWTLRDETTSNRFVLDGVTVAAGATIRFRTGIGTSDDDEVFLGERFPVWSNRGETVLLVDPDGVIAAHAFIEG